jgi:hypothetical protein
MNSTLKLTVTWLLLVTSTILSFFVFDLDRNGIFIGILAFKKFLLIGFIYLEGIKSHWLYRIILILGGASLLIATVIWRMPRVCN